MAENKYTERQRGQCYLINNLSKILEETGRTRGFPGTKAPDPDEGTMGPPAVAITRVIPELRNVGGTLTHGAAVTDGPDNNTMLSTFSPLTHFDIFDRIDSADLDDLIPEITLYKVYPDENDPQGGYPVEFANKWLDDMYEQDAHQLALQRHSKKEKSARDWQRHFGTIGDAPKVGITGLTIKKLGGNPAEVESNIEVSITIETHNINNLFLRQTPEDLPGIPPKDLLENGIAWIDLIKLNPQSQYNTNGCERVYNEDDLRIKLKIGYPSIDDPYLKTRCQDRHAKRTTSRNEFSRKKMDEVFSKGNFSKGGYESAEAALQRKAEHSGKGTDYCKDMQDILGNHNEIFTLVLNTHDIVIDNDLTVRMTINFLGYAEVLQRTSQADLLSNPWINRELETRSTQLTALRKRMAALAPKKPQGEEPTPEEQAENDLREACRERLEEETQALQGQYDLYLLEAKRRLYAQLRLPVMGATGGTTSRIYEVAIPDTDEIWWFSNPGAASPNKAWYKNYHDSWPEDMEADWKADRDRQDGLSDRKYANSLQDGIYVDAKGKPLYNEGFLVAKHKEFSSQKREELLKNVAQFGDYKFIQFVFLGDIVEAALEILAYNDQEYSQGMENGMGVGRDGVGFAGAPMFFREMNNVGGEVGPMAKKVIDRFGKYIFGDIRLPQLNVIEDPAASGMQPLVNERYVNIADIPIDLEGFRDFWYNNVTSKPKISKYYLKNLVTGLVNQLLPYALCNFISESGHSTSAENAQGILTYFSLAGKSTALNISGTDKWDAMDEAHQLRQEWEKEHGRPMRQLVFNERLAELERSPRFNTIQYAPYMGLKTAQGLITKAHEKAQNSWNPRTWDVFVIGQKPDSALTRHGIRRLDKESGIVHFKLIGDKRMLINVQFKKSDLPALGTANVMSDGGANKLGILREKYDATVQLKGTVAYKPGAVLYIDPRDLANEVSTPRTVGKVRPGFKGTGLKTIYPTVPAKRGGEWVGIDLSAARTLGLGGYFVVISVEHDFGHLGEKLDWKTTLNTRWLSFAYVKGLGDRVCDRPSDGRELTAEDEDCLHTLREVLAHDMGAVDPETGQLPHESNESE